MNIEAYLRRISATDELGSSPNADLLRLLQRRHLLAVPFENLDIHWKQPITIDVDRFYIKIVEGGRGGFCYELNGLFNELLVSLGFTTRIVSARVSSGASHGPEYDHAAVIVSIGKVEYLADVGFGGFTAEPLRLMLDAEQADANGEFVIRRFDDEYLEVAKRVGDAWKSEYIFKNVGRSLTEFADMCDYQQTSPQSHFTKGKLCSIMTANGRKTLTDSKYIVTSGERKAEREVAGDAEFYKLLNDEFGIERIQ